MVLQFRLRLPISLATEDCSVLAIHRHAHATTATAFDCTRTPRFAGVRISSGGQVDQAISRLCRRGNWRPELGTEDLGLFRVLGQPNLNFTVNRKAAARFQINLADVQDAIQSAVGGNALTQVLDGERRYVWIARKMTNFPGPIRSSKSDESLPQHRRLAFGILVAARPAQATRVWGWRRLEQLRPKHRSLYLRLYRAFGIFLGLAGILFALDSLLNSQQRQTRSQLKPCRAYGIDR